LDESPPPSPAVGADAWVGASVRSCSVALGGHRHPPSHEREKTERPALDMAEPREVRFNVTRHDDPKSLPLELPRDTSEGLVVHMARVGPEEPPPAKGLEKVPGVRSPDHEASSRAEESLCFAVHAKSVSRIEVLDEVGRDHEVPSACGKFRVSRIGAEEAEPRRGLGFESALSKTDSRFRKVHPDDLRRLSGEREG
jgi:hypothetical protein